MGWNKYSIKLFVFLVILSLLGFVFFWSLGSSQLVITKIVLALTFVLFFICLLKYLNKTNRDLNQFFEAIQHLDNVPSNENSDLSHNQLQLTYSRIIDELKEAWLSKESERQYFKSVLAHMGIGIISFDEDGKIEIYNKSAKEIFGLEHLGSVYKLNEIKENLGNDLFAIKSGQTKLLKFSGSIEDYNILAKSAEIILDKRRLNIISLQNIKTQMEESELEAWQKLIRILTHEIMNSVTPIKSLTYSMQKALMEERSKPIEIDTILKSLKAIENRSRGLLDFADTYKKLTQIPKPNYERLNIKNLFCDIENLLKTEFEINAIELKTKIEPDDLSFIADGKLISQVILNLIKNAIYALESSTPKKIELIALLTENERVCIKVIDNGKGIPVEILDEIFVPFFTTRDGGSGIGLSFARQVMVLHRGRINVYSGGNKTVFSLFF